MTVITEGARVGEFLAYELNPEISREGVTFASGNSFVSGQIVKGPLTAVVPAVPADTAGLFIAHSHTDATAAAQKGSAVVRGPVVVNANLLTYPAGATAPQKAAINAALVSVGIIVRS